MISVLDVIAEYLQAGFIDYSKRMDKETGIPLSRSGRRAKLGKWLGMN